MTSLLDVPPEAAGSARTWGLLGTVAVHGIIIAGASLVGVGGAKALASQPVTEMVEVNLPEPPPKPPEPPPPAAVPPPARIKAPTPDAAAEPPPEPAAAQAGQILDAKSDMVDFGDSFVTGPGDSFAGGSTDSKGTSKTAVQDVGARGAGIPVVEKPKPTVDKSRAPQLSGGASWQCPFPLEADDAGIDHAVVTLRVEVGADGGVQKVTATTDPGNGFGREARRCATSKRWSSGLDREGHPTSAVAIVNVRFDR